MLFSVLLFHPVGLFRLNLLFHRQLRNLRVQALDGLLALVDSDLVLSFDSLICYFQGVVGCCEALKGLFQAGELDLLLVALGSHMFQVGLEMTLLFTCLSDQGLTLDIINLRKLALQIYHVFAFFVKQSLLLGLALDDASVDLLLDDLACRIEHLIEVLLLLFYLISE